MKTPHRIGYDLLDGSLKSKVDTMVTSDIVYTKSETDQRIQGILGTAPANLDTLQELANALNNDENFASTIINELNTKVDIVNGKQLTTEDYTTSEKSKLIGIETNANNYIHPINHSPSIIVQDANNRLTTDSEKTLWGSAVTHISDLVKHITSSERTLWNSKANGTHTHVKANISDFPTIPTDTNQLIKTDVYTKTEVNNSLSLKSDTTHDHDGRYATPSQLALKSDTTHKHDDLYQVIGNYAQSSHNHDTTYAVKSIEPTVAQNTIDITAMETNMANGDMHSNIGILNQLTQGLLDLWNSAVTHISDAVKHITSTERTAWNAKQNALGFTAVPTTRTINSKALSANITLAKADIGLTNVDNTTDANKPVSTATSAALSGKADKSYVDTQDALKVDATTFNGHANNSTIHVTQTDKDNLALKSQIYQGVTEPLTSSYWFKEV